MLYKCNFICYIAVIHAVPLLGVEMEEVFQVDLGNIVDDVLMLAAGHVLLAAVHNLSVRNGVSVLVVLDLSYVGLNCSKSLGAVSSCTIVSFTIKRKLSAHTRDGLLHVSVSLDLGLLAKGDISQQHAEVVASSSAAIDGAQRHNVSEVNCRRVRINTQNMQDSTYFLFRNGIQRRELLGERYGDPGK